MADTIRNEVGNSVPSEQRPYMSTYRNIITNKLWVQEEFPGGRKWVEQAASPSYKIYKALSTQSGGTKPDLVVLENTAGLEIEASYTTNGVYVLTDANAPFAENKTVLLAGSGSDAAELNVAIARNSDTELRLSTSDTGASADDVLNETLIYIEIHD